MHASELWLSSSVKARLVRSALLPASWGYALGWEIYLSMYRFGVKKAKHPHEPILCIGNLQVGGSGKTPLCRYIARYLTDQGFKVAISCSGYGSSKSEGASLSPDGPLLASEWGDEAAMFRWLDPDIPLIVGRRRVRAAEIAHEELPDHVLLMDDGFQHLPLKKDLTVILDPEEPTNTYCLPAGPYREPRFNRKRADFVIPGEMQVVRDATTLVTEDGQEAKPTRYSVLCALGNPQNFLEDLKRYVPSQGGFEQVVLRPDHDSLTEGTLLDSFPTHAPIVVTAKDWVKIRERGDRREREFLIATQNVRLDRIDIIERQLRDKSRRRGS